MEEKTWNRYKSTEYLLLYSIIVTVQIIYSIIKPNIIKYHHCYIVCPMKYETFVRIWRLSPSGIHPPTPSAIDLAPPRFPLPVIHNCLAVDQITQRSAVSLCFAFSNNPLRQNKWPQPTVNGHLELICINNNGRWTWLYYLILTDEMISPPILSSSVETTMFNVI